MKAGQASRLARLSFRIDLAQGHRIGPGKIELLDSIGLEHGANDEGGADLFHDIWASSFGEEW